jgi:ubiquinone/menaquinone biosynthesis C-methylase UbiE
VGRYYHYPGADNPETYEWENRIADPGQRIEACMASIAPWTDRTLIDIGSGSAFHAARFAESAARVVAVEPSPAMRAQALRRIASTPHPNLSLVAADAEAVPLRDGVADVVHSRFAYFFGPAGDRVASCEPGIAEALRLLKPGGAFVVIDK